MVVAFDERSRRNDALEYLRTIFPQWGKVKREGADDQTLSIEIKTSHAKPAPRPPRRGPLYQPRNSGIYVPPGARTGLTIEDMTAAFDAHGKPAPPEPLRPGRSERDEDVRYDPVICTVFAPPKPQVGSRFLLQAFAHRPEKAEEARALAQEFDDSTVRRGFRSLNVEVAREERLDFHLVMPGLVVQEALQSLYWHGETSYVPFVLEVPSDRAPGPVIGTLIVSIQGVPVGDIAFKLDVASVAPQPAEPTTTALLGDGAQRYRLAFVSYSSKDRGEVLKRIQMLRTVGIKYFQDVVDLEPGNRFEPLIFQRIEECDLFLLFWSTAARSSEWVDRELQHALQRKAGREDAPPAIRPVILEKPPPPPPEALKDLHFNDYLLYLINPGDTPS
jgi:TIR domain